MKKRQNKIRVGVVGVGRGMSFAHGAEFGNMELVALCDTWEEKLEEAGKRLGVATYTEYDRFLEHEMDAVVLANYFHEHAPFAIKALEAGKHVMSETAACKTLAEGVALARAVERSGKIYMFAENYAYILYVQEMRRLYRAGEIGEVRYAEGEYNHPMDWRSRTAISPGVNHWRNHIPPTYYCTHALSPVMYVTDTMPLSVNAQAIANTKEEKLLEIRHGDPGFVMILRMSNGSVARLFGLILPGHHVWYRFHGTRGLMENLRTGNTGMLRVAYEEWNRKEDQPAERIYTPDVPSYASAARRAGHGGGDFFMNYHFAEAIRTGRQPWLDVYRGLAMSVAGIQAWRSCLDDGRPYEIPDFRKESVRKKYENDHWSPFPEDRGPGQPYPSILGPHKPSAKALAAARKIWREIRYKGK